MANAIALAKLYEPLLMEAYSKDTLTNLFENSALVSTMQSALANEVYVPEMTLTGLGDYSKTSGYPVGDINLSWVSLKLTQDRGRQFAIDVVDDMEAMKVAGANVMSQFLKFAVIPEVDAYRFAKWATGSDSTMRATATISTGSALVTAIDVASAKMTDASVPEDGRILCLTPTMYNLLKQAQDGRRFYVTTDSSIGRKIAYYDEMRIVVVPEARFYSGITTSATGYTNSGSKLNFMLIHPTAVVAITKHTAIKAKDPDVDIDAYKFAYRLYHDAFIVPNHEKGVYVHSVSALTGASA
jgi:hypothetical protein